MGPSFSSKNGVRYRFYVSTALRGRKHKAGSVTRIAAREIEVIVADAVRKRFDLPDASSKAVSEQIECVVLAESQIRVTLRSEDQADGSPSTTIEIPWTAKRTGPTFAPLIPTSDRSPNQNLMRAIVRSHAWLADLRASRYASIEELAAGVKVHPKVVRQALRLAFLSPGVTSAILEQRQPAWLTLRQIPKGLP